MEKVVFESVSEPDPYTELMQIGAVQTEQRIAEGRHMGTYAREVMILQKYFGTSTIIWPHITSVNSLTEVSKCYQVLVFQGANGTISRFSHVPDDRPHYQPPYGEAELLGTANELNVLQILRGE